MFQRDEQVNHYHVGMGIDEFEKEDMNEEISAPQHRRHQLFDEAEGIESVEDEHEAQDDGVTIDEDGYRMV